MTANTHKEALLHVLEYHQPELAAVAAQICREQPGDVTVSNLVTFQVHRSSAGWAVRVAASNDRSNPRGEDVLTAGVFNGAPIIDPWLSIVGQVLERQGWERVTLDHLAVNYAPDEPPRFLYQAPEATCQACPKFLRCKLAA